MQLPPSFESPFTLPPKSNNRLPPKNYRHILVLPPLPKSLQYRQKRKTTYRRKITVIFWFYRLGQSRYRQKTKNRLQPKNYRRMALPPFKRHQEVLSLQPTPKRFEIFPLDWGMLRRSRRVLTVLYCTTAILCYHAPITSL